MKRFAVICALLAVGCSKSKGDTETKPAPAPEPEAEATAAETKPEPPAPPPMPQLLAEGDEAPDFTVKDHTGAEVSLSALKGKPVVLYWYPKAFTGG